MSTKPLMIEKLKAAGAYEVVQRGATWQDADAFLRKEVMAKVYCSSLYCFNPYPCLCSVCTRKTPVLELLFQYWKTK